MVLPFIYSILAVLSERMDKVTPSRGNARICMPEPAAWNVGGAVAVSCGKTLPRKAGQAYAHSGGLDLFACRLACRPGKGLMRKIVFNATLGVFDRRRYICLRINRASWPDIAF